MPLLAIAGRTVAATDPAHSLDHSISLSDDLGKMFDSREGCDFLILVQRDIREEDDTPEGIDVTICAHHTILSQFPLFNASGETTSIRVVVSTACQQHFIPFIRYIESTMAHNKMNETEMFFIFKKKKEKITTQEEKKKVMYIILFSPRTYTRAKWT